MFETFGRRGPVPVGLPFLGVVVLGVAALCTALVVTPAPTVRAAAPGATATLDGTYVVRVADAITVETRVEYLRVGSTFYVLHHVAPDSARPNDQVRVTGTLDGTDLTVTSLAVRSAAPPAALAAPAAAPAAKSVLVILVKYGTATPTATQAQANSFVFTRVNAWYHDTSYDQLRFTGQVTAPLTIPDPGSCNWNGIATSAEQAVTNAGYNVGSYGLRVIDFPHRDDCLVAGRSDSLAGSALIGGPWVWLNDGLYNPTDGYSFLVPVHELGHGIGLQHAHSLNCAPATLTASCATSGIVDDYGNSWDAMGTNWPGNDYGAVAEFSAFGRNRMGWMANRVTTASTGQAQHIHLTALETSAATGTQAIRVVTPRHEYWVEYRQPIDQDAFLVHYPAVTSGVLVNMRDDVTSADGVTHADSALLLDMHPGTVGDFADAALQPGQTWSDPEGVFTLHLQPADAGGITVDVLPGRVSLPGPPTAVGAVPGNARVLLSWTAPSSTGGSPITGYRVTVDPGGRQLTLPASATGALVDGLTNGTPATFTIEAGNAVGWSDPTTVDATPTATGGAPSPPRNVSAAGADASATVSWDVPSSDGGSPITGYSVFSGPTLVATVTAPTTHATISGLTNGTPYTFGVVAANALNASGTAMSNPVTPAQPPAQPSEPAVVVKPSQSSRTGYWMLGGVGDVYAFGDAKYLGNAHNTASGPGFKVHLEPTPSGDGYWILDSTGIVTTAGDASWRGNATAIQMSAPGEHAASLSATPSGQGYWIFTDRGRALPYGDAAFFGDMSTTHLNGPVLGSIATPSGHGYYMVASDGGIFAFGDAGFHGSMGGTRLNAPVQSLVPTADNRGYWLVASDGGIFAFGDAGFRGSMGATRLNRPVVGMVRYGDGYLMVGADGGIFSFSDLPFKGSLGDTPPAVPITGVAALG
ncbi:MAG: fibronectin type III domain-containing protein [Acidimicrobiia bacterium]